MDQSLPQVKKGVRDNTRTVSFFEFWPSWLMYAPVAVQWLGLALYYRSFTLPFLANPSLPLSGMVGVGKSELMSQSSGTARAAILPWMAYEVQDSLSPDAQATAFLSLAAENDITLPFVCKPDIGCRGVGVKYVEHKSKLEEILSHYPTGAYALCQKLADYEAEVGVFCVKDPVTGQVDIPSLTLKTLPRIVGDGVQTLGQLIASDARAGQLEFLYKERHKTRWDEIITKGEVVRLVFSASHSKGAVFEDIRDQVTPALKSAIEAIMNDLPDFHYGRLDVKFKDLDSLQRGETLQVIEINGASAESIHIWDKNTSLLEAMRALLWQYRTLFKLGAYHRKQGKKPPSLFDLWRGWKLEQRLSKSYPLTD